ncbi:MAG TPA: alanine racemase, partial [Bryobacteraceae bacterium]
MPVQYRSWVEISTEQICANFRAVRAATGSAVETAAVVKSDAYGHGAAKVAHALAAQGARWFAVTSAEEGVALREAGIEADILVMADGLPFTWAALVDYRLTPALHGLELLRALDEYAAARGVIIPYHLKLDTGMGRMGALDDAQRIAAVVRAAKHLELGGLMSHFASAADFSTPQADCQTETFGELCGELAKLGIAPPLRHMASTNAVAYGRREAFHNMVRIGLGLYGYVSPASGRAPRTILDVQPALAWKAAVIAAKQVPEGALIGYGGLYRATRPTTIAVLGAGYADGVPHRLSNRWHVLA